MADKIVVSGGIYSADMKTKDRGSEGQVQVILSEAQSAFLHGSKAVGASAVQLSVSSIPLQTGLLIKADENNSGDVYVGNSNAVTAGVAAPSTDGYRLASGGFVNLAIKDVNLVWLIGSGAGQAISWIGV